MKIESDNNWFCQCGMANGMVRILSHPAILLSMLLLFTSHCLSNDSIGYLGAGGIEFKKTEDISMEEEVLTISRNLIRVEYEFLNRSPKPIKETIIFPMPFYGFDEGCSSQHSGELEEFKVWVNTQKLSPSRAAQARLGDRDVTNRLKELGFTDEDITEYRGAEGYCFSGDTPPPTGALAKNLDVLVKEGLASVTNDGTVIVTPEWKTAYFYSWNQEFPPMKKIRVAHEYIPFKGKVSGTINFDRKSYQLGQEFSNSLINEFCITEGALRAGEKIQSGITYGQLKIPASGLAWGSINYILTTGANWAGPIKDFTLNLKKENANQFVSLCFDGPFIKRDPLTLSSHIKNFLPKKNISVIFFYPEPDEFAPSSGGYVPGYRRQPAKRAIE